MPAQLATSISRPYDPVRPESPWTQPSNPIPGAEAVRAIVLQGYGLNCQDETTAALAMLGARVERVHVADLLARGRGALTGVHLVTFVGGFSFGDHIASGRVLANLMRGRLGDDLAHFVDDGGLVLGICNGFQTLVKMGLLPAVGRRPGEPLAPQQATLEHNDRPGFRNAWVKLRIDPQSPCVFTRGQGPALLELPARHGEGKLIVDPAILETIEREHLVPVRYADGDGHATETWPDNPNGSAAGMAGLCDPTGRVFGLMPHPEAYLYPENHPDWIEQRDAGALPTHGLGLGLFANGLRALVG